MFFGAGSSAVGVAETICQYLTKQGIAPEDAKKMFWLVDSKVRFLPSLFSSATVPAAELCVWLFRSTGIGCA